MKEYAFHFTSTLKQNHTPIHKKDRAVTLCNVDCYFYLTLKNLGNMVRLASFPTTAGPALLITLIHKTHFT